MCSEGDLRRWTRFAAAWLPLAVYVFTAAGQGYWLDSAEFDAAAIELDIPHPPGHPLFSLWSTPFTWLPIGPLPFRVAVGQAAAAAIALSFVQRALERSLRIAGLEGPWTRNLFALAGALTLAFAYGFWFQAVRGEVYALQAMLVCIAFERVTAFLEREDVRALFAACLALGFGLANHHFIAVLAMPVLAWPAWRSLRRYGAQAVGLCIAFGGIGLLAYAYLPLRALSQPPMDLGHPATWRDFGWVVSAQVYARRVGTDARQPLDERLADLLVLLDENLGLLVMAFAVLGAYALLRVAGTRALASLWLLAALISLVGRAFLNEVRDNPDVLGYMLPGFLAVVALALHGIAALSSRASRRAGPVVASLLIALSFLHGTRQAPRASLRTFQATDRFDDLRRRMLPANALVILTTPDVVFRHWEGEAIEQLRRDVTMLPLPFIGYGGTEAILRARHPELALLIDDYQRTGYIAPAFVAKLARTRPVFVELDTTTTFALMPQVTPRGLLYRVGELDAEDARVRLADDAKLEVQLGTDSGERETERHLLWVRYVEALYFAHRGAVAEARIATRAALARLPMTRELVQLDRALESAPVPFDVTPFLVRGR